MIRFHRLSHHSPASGSIRAEAGTNSKRNFRHGAAENHGHLATVSSRCGSGMGMSRLNGQDWPGGGSFARGCSGRLIRGGTRLT